MENSWQALLKVDYASIQQKPELEAIIHEHQVIIKNLIKQIHQLNTIQDKEEIEKEIIINKMQEKMLENTHQIINIKNMINKTTEDHNRSMKQFEEEKSILRKNFEVNNNLEMNQHFKKVEQLENQYKNVKEFEEVEQQYLNDIESLKKSLIQKQYIHHDHMNEEEKKQLKENLHLQNQNVLTLSETKKNVYNFAVGVVFQEKVLNEEKNLELKTKLIVLQNQLSKLKKERSELMNKRKQFKINVSLNEQQLEEYKAVGSIQKAKIKANKDKVEKLKNLISEEIAKRQDKIAIKKKQKNVVLKGMKSKIFSLEREKEELRNNMEKIKILGDTILLQREEVQRFFIMSLQECKKEVDSQNNKVFNVGKQQKEKGYGERVDIEELAPKDKQRIITNLYTKLALGP